MRHSPKTLVCALGALSICAVAAPNVNEPSENPYQAIVERNVFSLRDPPPPPKPEEVKPPPPKLTLTGITTLLGRKMVLLKAPPAPGPVKPGEPPKTEQFFTLAEGQQDGELEIVNIDEKAGVVNVKYGGVPASLNFADNGAKPMPGMPMPGGIPAPMPNPAFNPQVQPQMPGVTPMPTRTLRLPTQTSTWNPGGTGTPTPAYGAPATAGNVMTYSAGGGQVLQPVGYNTAPNPQAQVNPIQQLPAEHQFILTEAERERTRNAVAAGLLPPLPPTPLSQMQSPNPTPNVQSPVRRLPPRAPGLPQLPQ